MTTEMISDAAPPNKPVSNVPELTVSELAFALKKTLEESFGRVRVRGELSRVTIPRSGHMYADIKDENAVLNTVCWKGTLAKLSVKPEEGLEVICTGRMTSYPARSNYQLVIESMELAGEGALLKMLEERRKRLTAEGLFAPERKKKRPFLPEVIGIVTSPTGAVIRDIMHRLEDRFPRHVLLWPALVQGDGAAAQVAAAIRGFDNLPEGGVVPRPDLLIVARGGGSLEDLMPFNEEIVVRAVADCRIPVISAIGHETDTTLIDYAADLRAPTPTGAAELAVPVRAEILAFVLDSQKRMISAAGRLTRELRSRTEALAARLGDPARLLEIKTQRLDHISHKLGSAFERGLALKQSRMERLGAQLRHPKALMASARERLEVRTASLQRIGPRLTEQPGRQLSHASRMLESLSFHRILDRGFVVVRDSDGAPVTAAEQTHTGQRVQLEFKGDRHVGAVIGDHARAPEGTRQSGTQGKLL